ncbi:MAG: VCBS repeat-containing protein, partial [Myxococcales bacterium]|nr:VCBS repeat-containing protein [Myxococcales bacterium]
MADRRLRWIGAVALAALGCDPGITRDNPCDPQAPASLQQTSVLIARFVLPEGVVGPGPIALTRAGDDRRAVLTDSEQVEGQWVVTYRLDDLRPGVHALDFAAEGLTPGAALQVVVPPCSEAVTLGPIELVRTTTPPAVLDVRVAGGNPFVNADPVGVTVTCVDDQTPPEAMRLRLEGDARFDGPWQPSVRVEVGDEGPKRIVATCIDSAGNASAPVEQAFLLDTSAPAVPTFDLDCARGGAPTRQLNVTACITATDAGSGVEALALAEDPHLDCANAAYLYAPGEVPFALRPGDGEHPSSVFVPDCVADVLAPVAPPPRQPAQTAPAAPRVILGDGGDYARAAQVTLTLEGVADDVAEVRIGGDVQAPYDGALADRPAEIRLAEGQGARAVEVVVVDAAGNASPPGRAAIIVDSVPPPAGDIVVAGGQGRVNTRIVPVTVDGAADFTALWTPPARGTCASTAPECDDAVFKPFAALTTHTLPEAQGAWRVCWRFCDAAGNASEVVDAGRSIELGPFLARPRPVLDDLAPASIVALTPGAQVTLSGRGIAADTRARFGDFDLPCRVAGGADCQADAGGGCSDADRCAQTCATQCVVPLPPDLLRRAGSYVVRLATPDPVVDGLNQSEAQAVLDLVGPLPQLIDLWPRGILQPLGPDGEPPPGPVQVTLRARGLTDNAQYRIGPNYGQVIAEPEPLDEAGDRKLVIEIPTDGLRPSDRLDNEFAAVNPGPGGGIAAVPFGVNPVAAHCEAGLPCLSNLRATRAALPGERTLAQGFTLEPADDMSGLSISGAEAVQLRDAEGALLARFATSDGARPVPVFSRPAVSVLEHGLGQTPLISRRPAQRYGTGEFAPVIADPPIEASGRVALADLDGDGLPELLLTDPVVGTLRVDDALYDTTPNAGQMAVADLDADGWPDVVVASEIAQTVAVHFNRGEGVLERGIGLAQGASVWGAPLLVDLDEDGRTDLLTCTGDGLVWRRNLGARNFADVAPLGPDDVTCVAVAAADMDGDHRFDLITFQRALGQVAIHRRTGDGGLDPAQVFPAVPVLPAGPGIEGRQQSALVVGDLDADGAPDVVVGDTDAVQVLYNDGQGGLDPGPPLPHGESYTEALALADVDADGWPDLFGGTASLLGWWRGGPNRHWDSLLPLGVAARSLAVQDRDGDGALDVVAVDPTTATPSAWQNVGRPGVGALVQLPRDEDLGRAPRWADVDSDGHLDLVGVGQDAVLRVAYGDGEGGFRETTSQQLDFGVEALAVTDVDADGRPDLIGYTAGQLMVARGDADGAFGPPTWHVVGGGAARCLAVANLDDDPEPEAVLGANHGFQVIDDLGGVPTVAYSADQPTAAVTLADLDVDGDLDLVSVSDAHVYGCLNLGGLAFAPLDVLSGEAPADRVQVTDLNADGHPDLVIGGPDAAPYKIHTCISNGDGTFEPPELVAEEAGGRGNFVLADLNGDGADDLIMALQPPTRLLVAPGVLGAGFAPLRVRADRSEVLHPEGIDVGDMDGDGVPDVVIGAYGPTPGPGQNAVWLWRPPGPMGVVQALREPFAPLPVPAGA